MRKREFIGYTLGIVLCTVVGLALGLWRLGLAPVYAGLISVNVVTLLLYGYDKRQAVVGGTRVPEVVLHGAALCGGSPGAALGQGLFQHKTQKRSFRLVFAAIVLLQIAAVYGYWRLTHAG